MTKKLQVFVSSTYTDLIEERQAAVGAILKAGHIPAGVELFTAGDDSQLTIIKRWIEQSDIYMLILGGRYGSVHPTLNLAYTELEFDYAMSIGKPMFCTVVTEAGLNRKVRDGSTDFIERENGKLLAAFREKVMSKLVAWFSDEKDIRLAVHESMAEFVRNKDLIGWVPGNTAVDTIPLFEDQEAIH